MSKPALWATSTAPRANSRNAGSADSMRGASATIAVVMPVSDWMNGGIGRCGLTRVWNSPSTSPPRTLTAPISVIAESAGLPPVVSRSTTTNVTSASAVPRSSKVPCTIWSPAVCMVPTVGRWCDSPWQARPAPGRTAECCGAGLSRYAVSPALSVPSPSVVDRSDTTEGTSPEPPTESEVIAMIIDCQSCPVRDLHCADCMVTACSCPRVPSCPSTPPSGRPWRGSPRPGWSARTRPPRPAPAASRGPPTSAPSAEPSLRWPDEPAHPSTSTRPAARLARRWRRRSLVAVAPRRGARPAGHRRPRGPPTASRRPRRRPPRPSRTRPSPPRAREDALADAARRPGRRGPRPRPGGLRGHPGRPGLGVRAAPARPVRRPGPAPAGHLHLRHARARPRAGRRPGRPARARGLGLPGGRALQPGRLRHRAPASSSPTSPSSVAAPSGGWPTTPTVAPRCRLWDLPEVHGRAQRDDAGRGHRSGQPAASLPRPRQPRRQAGRRRLDRARGTAAWCSSSRAPPPRWPSRSVRTRTRVAQVAAVTDGPFDPQGRAGADRVVVNPGAFATLQTRGQQVVVTHEATHVAIRATTNRPVPLWLSEGMADYVGYRDVGATRTPGRRGPARPGARRHGPQGLPAAGDFDPSRTTIAPSYNAAWLAVNRIVDRYGSRGPGALLPRGGHHHRPARPAPRTIPTRPRRAGLPERPGHHPGRLHQGVAGLPADPGAR